MSQNPDPQQPQPDPAQFPQQNESFPPPPYGQPQGEPALEPEPKKKSAWGKRLASIAVILAVAGFGIWQSIQAKAGMEAGNCLVMSGDSENNVDHKEVECDDTSQFSMKVVSVSSQTGECDPNATEYSVSTRRGGATVACMIPNFQPGQCYNEVESNAMFEIADCGSAHFKISKVEDSSTFECAVEELPWSYTEPAKTFCLADPTS
ncbi:MAG: hypothetical protein Q4G46_00110 [Propionibacteriaceae bacterium]|nr:hypothetical protein [Propionibacteriaceae bacterium]